MFCLSKRFLEGIKKPALVNRNRVRQALKISKVKIKGVKNGWKNGQKIYSMELKSYYSYLNNVK